MTIFFEMVVVPQGCLTFFELLDSRLAFFEFLRHIFDLFLHILLFEEDETQRQDAASSRVLG